MNITNRIDPDAEVFIPGQGRAITLPNGNSVHLYPSKQPGDDWMFQFHNKASDRRTLLRVSPAALYAIASLASEAITDGKVERPDFQPEVIWR